MGGVWSKHVDNQFLSSQAWDEFVLHMWRYILCPRLQGMGLVNTFLDTYCFLAVLSTQVEMHLVSRWHSMCLVDTCSDAFSVLSGMGRNWLTHFAIHFVSSLALEEFGGTNVKMHFLFSLAMEGLC